MRKILLILMVSFLTLLVACEDMDNNHELPNIDDFSEMELTLGEKVDFFVNLDLDNTYENGFSFNQYFKGNLDFNTSSRQEYDYGDEFSYYRSEDATATLNFDYDTVLYVDIKDSLDDFLIYAAINKLMLSGLVENSYEEYHDFDEETHQENGKHTIDLNLNDSFFLILENDAYFKLNGVMKVSDDDNNIVDETFDNVKEKVEGVFQLEEYQDFKEGLDDAFDMFGGFDEEMPDFDDLEDLGEFNDLVKVYKKGNEHIINMKLTTSAVHSYIDLVADQFAGFFINDMDDFEEFETMIQNIKNSIKKMEFDFNIYVKDNRLSKVSFDVKLTVDNLDFEFDQSDEYREDYYSLEGSFKLEKFGFVVDFNATSPNLPTAAELAVYEVVDEPSFGGLFNQ
ncbi:MAG: hypothetical protein WC907_05160 [Acholeplasmataceae bacterium]